MSNKFKCKKCGAEIEVTEAIRHDIEENLIRSIESKHKGELEEVVRKTEEKATLKAKEAIESKLKDMSKENEEEKERNKDLNKKIGDLLDELRALRRKDQDRDIEIKKEIMDMEEKIRLEVTNANNEKSNLEIAELKKKLTDTEISLIEAQKKTKQGSQQLQGEVLELDLENRLRSTFHNDEIEPVGKGVSGADVIQRVKNNQDRIAGIILWETKRARWSPSWLPKLRDDVRRAGASVGVMLTDELPKGVSSFEFTEGVLVTSYSYAIPLAVLLRRQLMQLASAKSAAVNKDQTLEKLYNFFQSDTFRHRFEAFVEGVVEMQQNLESEKRSMNTIWKKREGQISKSLDNLTGLYGDLQGIMGKSLPDIKSLSLPEGSDEDRISED